jgi:hypothetical protein
MQQQLATYTVMALQSIGNAHQVQQGAAHPFRTEHGLLITLGTVQDFGPESSKSSAASFTEE